MLGVEFTAITRVVAHEHEHEIGPWLLSLFHIIKTFRKYNFDLSKKQNKHLLMRWFPESCFPESCFHESSICYLGLFVNFLVFLIKNIGYFGIFLYILILKQKSVLRRSKQGAKLVKTIQDS